MLEEDLKGLEKKTNEFYSIYLELKKLVSHFESAENDEKNEISRTFKIRKENLILNMKPLRSTARGYLIGVDANLKKNPSSNDLLYQKKRLEIIVNQIDDMTKELESAVLEVPAMGSHEEERIKNHLAALLSLSQSIGLINSKLKEAGGAERVFLDDEGMEIRFERIESSFIKEYLILRSNISRLSKIQRRVFEGLKNLYNQVFQRVRIRSGIKEKLAMFFQKIKDATIKLNTLPQPGALATIKESNPALYTDVITFERNVLDPLNIEIGQFLRKSGAAIRREDFDFLSQANIRFTNYIQRYG